MVKLSPTHNNKSSQFYAYNLFAADILLDALLNALLNY